jgi:hypothetical protein
VITQPDTPPTPPEQMPASSWNIQAPVEPGPTDRIAGAARDDVASTVAGAVTTAEQRYLTYVTDTYGQGSTIGVLMDLPDVSTTGDMGGAYYDPPRNY